MILSLNLKIQRVKIKIGVYDVFVSILNLENRCSNSATSLVQQWIQISCPSSAISFEDQVC